MSGPAVTAPLAVAVSPHLDDAVFSVGGLLAALVEHGWRVRVVTALTASVPGPTGFALACQTDKGLGADVDYMALRRGEDLAATAHLGVVDVVHLPLPEAPHRGYASAAELFSGARDDDDLVERLVPALAPHLAGADLVLAPQALGGHVDHVLVARAVLRLSSTADGLAEDAGPLWWRDSPYVIRDPGATSPLVLPDGLAERSVDVGAVLGRKVAACQEYASQLGFQFGGPQGCAQAVTALARSEARRVGGAGDASEVLSGSAPAWPAGVRPSPAPSTTAPSATIQPATVQPAVIMDCRPSGVGPQG